METYEEEPEGDDFFLSFLGEGEMISVEYKEILPARVI